MLRTCPDLKILATSREALGIAGERGWVVPSLSLPDPQDPPSVQGLRRYEAIGLFVERAKAVASTFELTDRNAEAVVRLCHRLEGVPLAIELGAARTKVLSVEQILNRLEDSLKLLTGTDRTVPERQRTLRGALDWSYELLGEQERKLFGRLSVFAGDYLMGGPGKDTLRGGQNYDQYFFGPGWREDTIIDGATHANGVHFRKAHLENVPVTEDLTIRLTSGAGPEVKSEGSTNTIEWEDDTISAAWGGYGDDKITGNSAATT